MGFASKKCYGLRSPAIRKSHVLIGIPDKKNRKRQRVSPGDELLHTQPQPARPKPLDRYTYTKASDSQAVGELREALCDGSFCPWLTRAGWAARQTKERVQRYIPATDWPAEQQSYTQKAWDGPKQQDAPNAQASRAHRRRMELAPTSTQPGASYNQMAVSPATLQSTASGRDTALSAAANLTSTAHTTNPLLQLSFNSKSGACTTTASMASLQYSSTYNSGGETPSDSAKVPSRQALMPGCGSKAVFAAKLELFERCTRPGALSILDLNQSIQQSVVVQRRQNSFLDELKTASQDEELFEEFQKERASTGPSDKKQRTGAMCSSQQLGLVAMSTFVTNKGCSKVVVRRQPPLSPATRHPTPPSTKTVSSNLTDLHLLSAIATCC